MNDLIPGQSRELVPDELRRAGLDRALTPVEAALLVKLYDSMGALNVTAVAMMYSGRLWDEGIQPAYDGLSQLGLVSAEQHDSSPPVRCRADWYELLHQRRACAHQNSVNIFLTDRGMIVANIIQEGYDRSKVERLVDVPKMEFPEAPIAEAPEIPELDSPRLTIEQPTLPSPIEIIDPVSLPPLFMYEAGDIKFTDEEIDEMTRGLVLMPRSEAKKIEIISRTSERAIEQEVLSDARNNLHEVRCDAPSGDRHSFAARLSAFVRRTLRRGKRNGDGR